MDILIHFKEGCITCTFPLFFQEAYVNMKEYDNNLDANVDDLSME